MMLGYHTAGLLLHDEPTAIVELARIGYRCVAIRPRRGAFNPLDADFPAQAARVATTLAHTGIAGVLDADSRFVHDPRRSDGPSLVSSELAERSAAVRWIERLVEVADQIGCSLITLSVGRFDALGQSHAADLLDRLADELSRLLDHAKPFGVDLALRPLSATPVSSVAQYERLQQWLRSPAQLRLAADVGEMVANSELPLGERLARNAGSLACVYLSDVHSVVAGDHRVGQGEVNLRRILDALGEQAFQGPAIIRIQGHEQLGFAPAEEAFALLGGSL